MYYLPYLKLLSWTCIYMEKIKYIHERICLCRNCGGAGTVSKCEPHDTLNQHPEIKVCTLCNGSGRVKVSGTVKTKIIPYCDENEKG